MYIGSRLERFPLPLFYLAVIQSCKIAYNFRNLKGVKFVIFNLDLLPPALQNQSNIGHSISASLSDCSVRVDEYNDNLCSLSVVLFSVFVHGSESGWVQ